MSLQYKRVEKRITPEVQQSMADIATKQATVSIIGVKSLTK